MEEVKKCEGCQKAMNDAAVVPYIVHEAAMERNDRVFRRMWAVVILLVVLLVGSNIGWLIYESQFETIEEIVQEVSQETSDNGSNLFVGGDYFGETSD